MEVQIGGFLESRLAWSAAAALATTSPCARYVDMDTPLMFQEDPVEGGLGYGANGALMLPKATGIGASINERYRSGPEQV